MLIRKFLATRKYLLGSILVLSFSAASGAVQDAESDPVNDLDISKSWEGAEVYVPGKLFRQNLTGITYSSPTPVVVFMHGCAGIQRTEREWADFLTSLGFVVILPDSFAIPNRPATCYMGGTNRVRGLGMSKLRPIEAAYAYRQVAALPWVDKKNIFLMGHSEGGMATARSEESGYAAKIITGFKCSKKIKGSKSKPVLVQNWDFDPWFDVRGSLNAQCSDRLWWKELTKAQEIVLPGEGHSTVDEVAARDSVANFLRNNRQ